MREMKDSGVEWIGCIPIEWAVAPIKSVADCFGRIGFRGYTAEDLVDEGEGAITLSPTNILNWHIDLSKCSYLSWEKYYESPEIMVNRNDIIFVKTASVGKCAIYESDEIATVNPQFVVFKNLKCNHRFLFYCLVSDVIQGQLSLNNMGGVIQTITQKNLLAYKICIPDEKEQNQIADYLDSKCSKIDEIIAKQEQIIEKLKEYKLSVITEAVTKGLNPNVEMKESKIEFCDYIPTHWGISQNRYLFTLRDEKNYKPLEDVQLLSLYTDLGVFPHGEQEERGNKAVTADGYKVVYENDIVVNIILAWMGAIGRSAYDGVTSPAYDIYKPYLNVCSRFYHYLYRTKAFSAECYKYGRGIMAMRWRTYSSEFKSIRVPVPPYDEQVRIAEYLDEKCAFIEKSIKDRINAVSKLQEYRKSLIYEVVTGKKEV